VDPPRSLSRGDDRAEDFFQPNVILAEAFAARFDGFSISSNDLTQLVLRARRDPRAFRGTALGGQETTVHPGRSKPPDLVVMTHRNAGHGVFLPTVRARARSSVHEVPSLQAS
jgi:hypothetical protein